MLEDVERCAAEATACERLDEGGLVDGWTATDVHQHRVRAQRSEDARIDRVARRARERQRDDEVIALRGELVHRHDERVDERMVGAALRVPAVGDDPHATRLRESRARPTEVAVAEDAHRRPRSLAMAQNCTRRARVDRARAARRSFAK